MCDRDTYLDESEMVEEEKLYRLEAEGRSVCNKFGEDLARLRVQGRSGVDQFEGKETPSQMKSESMGRESQGRKEKSRRSEEARKDSVEAKQKPYLRPIK